MPTEMRFDEFCGKVNSSPEFPWLRDYLRASGRFDAAIDTGQIARALLYVKRTVYETKYPQLMARQIIPLAADQAPAGAEQISTLLWNGVGQAKIISNYAQDLPRVDATVGEDISPVKTLGEAYGYTVLDLARAAMSGQPLNAEKARRAVRGFEQSIDDIAALGDLDTGVPGLLNNANVPVDAATGAWSGLTAVQILGDIARLVSNMFTATSAAEQPTDLVLPMSLWALVSQTPYSTLNGQSILSVFQANNPFIQRVRFWYKLDTAGAGGIKRIMALRSDPEVLGLEIPLDMTQLPPEPRVLEFIINCWGRIGGVKVRYPLAIRFMDGA
jgi:hypothetical protein